MWLRNQLSFFISAFVFLRQSIYLSAALINYRTQGGLELMAQFWYLSNMSTRIIKLDFICIIRILSNFRSDPENEMFSQFYRHIYNSEALKSVQGLFVSKVHFHSVAYSPFSKSSVWFLASLSLISRSFYFADIKSAFFSYIPLFSLLAAPGYCKKLKKKSNKIQKVVFLKEMTLYTIKLLTII